MLMFIHYHALYWKVFFLPYTRSQYFLFIKDSRIYFIILGFAALSYLVFGSLVKYSRKLSRVTVPPPSWWACFRIFTQWASMTVLLPFSYSLFSSPKIFIFSWNAFRTYFGRFAISFVLYISAFFAGVYFLLISNQSDPSHFSIFGAPSFRSLLLNKSPWWVNSIRYRESSRYDLSMRRPEGLTLSII